MQIPLLEIKIDPEFEQLIPNLTDEELNGLDQAIKTNGYDQSFPIILWNKTIIDGHNRYRICQKYQIEPRYESKEFKSKEDVVNWIIANQLNRRNITKEQRKYLIGKRYTSEKKAVGGQINNKNAELKVVESNIKNKGEIISPLNFDDITTNNTIKTAKKIAQENNISDKTVKNDEKFAKAVDSIAKNTAIKPQEILSGKIKATEKDITTIAALPKETQQAIITKIKDKPLKEVKQLIQEVKLEEHKAEIKQKLETIIPTFEDKNQLICGDALVELAKLPDHSINLLITDPPYGIDYISNHSQFESFITKEGILNDTDQNADKLLEQTIELLDKKMKDNSHLYLFSAWKRLPEFEFIIRKYFEIKNVLIWDKGNHGSGDLKGSWGNRYECIIFASRGKRDLNCRKADIISVARINPIKLIHPTQKPVELIAQLLEVSLLPGDIVIDPFMGSGSTIKALKNCKIPNTSIGIELDQDRFNQAKVFING